MSLSNTLKERLFRNTGFFKRNDGYSTVRGNYDGQGVSFGPVTTKTATGDGFARSKPENEDLARLALENGVPLNEIINEIK